MLPNALTNETLLQSVMGFIYRNALSKQKQFCLLYVTIRFIYNSFKKKEQKEDTMFVCKDPILFEVLRSYLQMS